MDVTTIAGQQYVVTSAAGCTVTDETGRLNLTVEAGRQAVFIAISGSVTVSDDAAVVLPFDSAAPAALGGGGESCKVFIGEKGTITIGSETQSEPSQYSVAIGSYNSIQQTTTNRDSFSCVVVGLDNKSQGEASVAIGMACEALVTHSVAIGMQAKAQGTATIALGWASTAEGGRGIAIGESSCVSGAYGIAIGENSYSADRLAIAIGGGAYARAEGSIQLGTGENVKPNTLQVFNKTLLEADGSIPFERVADSIFPHANVVDMGIFGTDGLLVNVADSCTIEIQDAEFPNGKYVRITGDGVLEEMLVQFSPKETAPTFEVWFETGDIVPEVTWDENIIWLEGSAPELTANTAYCICVRAERRGLLVANVAYNFTPTNLQS